MEKKKPNLGKLLPVGDTFVTTTKKMSKDRSSGCKFNADFTGALITYEVYQPGEIRTFVKGKRSYVCKVLGLVELKTGFYGWMSYPTHHNKHKMMVGSKRWYMFSYLVIIIEN